jgi:hypothetical protein
MLNSVKIDFLLLLKVSAQSGYFFAQNRWVCGLCLLSSILLKTSVIHHHQNFLEYLSEQCSVYVSDETATYRSFVPYI